MLFNAIASGSEELLPKLTITEKWCSSIISSLLEVGLVRKQEDKYYLTSVGRIFYHAYINLSNAMDNLWKLKCIDILEESDKIPRVELARVINTIIADNKIREILNME